MIKYELFLKYQKLKSSNKDGFNFLLFSLHILCLIDRKRHPPHSWHSTEETHQLQDFCNRFTDPFYPFLILHFFLQIIYFVFTAEMLPPSQDSIFNHKAITDVEEHVRGLGIFMVEGLIYYKIMVLILNFVLQ